VPFTLAKLARLKETSRNAKIQKPSQKILPLVFWFWKTWHTTAADSLILAIRLKKTAQEQKLEFNLTWIKVEIQLIILVTGWTAGAVKQGEGGVVAARRNTPRQIGGQGSGSRVTKFCKPSQCVPVDRKDQRS